MSVSRFFLHKPLSGSWFKRKASWAIKPTLRQAHKCLCRYVQGSQLNGHPIMRQSHVIRCSWGLQFRNLSLCVFFAPKQVVSFFRAGQRLQGAQSNPNVSFQIPMSQRKLYPLSNMLMEVVEWLFQKALFRFPKASSLQIP